MRKESVLIICAHPDDEVFGVGGTIAKYVSEGKQVSVVVFSYGEKSHAWLKREFSIKMRKKEHNEAKRVLGYKDSFILGAEEGIFLKDKEKIKMSLIRVIRKERPTKIFTHNLYDPHPDHRVVNKIVVEVCDDYGYKGEIYMFDIWNVINFRRVGYPILYVNISDTFKKKIEALGCFKSQWSSMIALLWNVYSNAIAHGFTYKTRFAERFFKLR